MKKIQTIGSEPKQKLGVILDDGSEFTMELEFKPMQYGWFIMSLVYGDIEINGLRMVSSPNMLHQFKNQLPFGLACETTDGGEPMLRQDFASGRCNLYVLDEDEIDEFSEIISGQVES